MTGSPEELAATLLGLADEEITHVQIFLMPTTPATVDGFGDVLERLDQASPASG